jgi:WW domain-containing oxidoreductase
MSPRIPFGRKSTADDVLAGLTLTGKTVAITGCNSGIGFETMRALATHGAHVIGLARTWEGADGACRRVGGATTPIACDLSDLSSVRQAIDAVRSLDRPVDTVITNAGIMASNKLQVRHGVEMQFLVNYLSHFLLITEVLDLVPDQTGRVVIVSSRASVDQAPKEGILFDNLDGHEFYSPFAFYGQSKLAAALFAKELSRRLKSRGIDVNSLHPGAVRGTGLARHFAFPLNIVMKVASLFMKSVPQGAATQVLLAASPLVAGISGEYWADCHVSRGSKFLNDAHMSERLWEESKAIVAKQESSAT